MSHIDPFELLSNLELDIEDDMDYNHPLRKMINAIRESIVTTSHVDAKKLETFLEKERVRNE